MKERRRFTRHRTLLKAQYFLKDKKEVWGECTITDVCQKGMGIIFLTSEKIEVGSAMLLEIPLHRSIEPVHIVGVLKWMKPSGNDFIGGIESTELLSDLKLYYSPLEK
jgi:hypothetical protein